MPEKALNVYENIGEASNNVIHAIVFTACASQCDERAIELGNRLYRELCKTRKNDTVLLGSVLNMLMKFGQVDDAQHLFAQIRQPTVPLFGVMMHGYNINRQPKASTTLFGEIKQKRLIPNDAVFLALINTASQIGMRSFCYQIIDELLPHHRNELKFTNALINMWVCVCASSSSLSHHHAFYLSG